MTTLLHISASPRGERSESLAIAQTFLDVYADTHPETTIETWDLWDGSLRSSARPPLTPRWRCSPGRIPRATRLRGGRRGPRSSGSPRPISTCSASRCGTPAFPTSSSSFIDVVSQPGMVFSFDPELGYTGLLTGRKAAVVYTSAVYGLGRPPSFGADFQAPYLRDGLNWAGMADVTEIAFRPNLATADAETGRQAAHAAARDAAKIF